jgi:hypothetical protein
VNVQIVSVTAIAHEHEHIVWAGEVPIAFEGLRLDESDPAVCIDVNSQIFRCLNRVDGADSGRLARMGYMLPSLSVGDLIHWRAQTWRVAATGFERVGISIDRLLS